VETALPGLLWLGFILAGVLGLGRTFLVERENDCWEGLVLTPGDKSAIYLGKLAGNILVMAVVEATLLVLFTVFFGLDLTGVLPRLVVVLALGTVGLATVGTLFGAITARPGTGAPGRGERDGDRPGRAAARRGRAVAQAPGRRRRGLSRGRPPHLRVRSRRRVRTRGRAVDEPTSCLYTRLRPVDPAREGDRMPANPVKPELPQTERALREEKA
jgi:hypothetical protein